MNCGRSSSVEWKLPKLQRRVRFPSPAPPPPGRAPGGFVMPARGELHDMRVDTPVTYGRRASCRAKPPPLQAGRAHGAYKTVRNTGWCDKTRPARLLHRHFREKTRPASTKTPNLGCFEPAGRTISRPAWQVLEVETIATTTTHSYSPHETTSTTAHLR